MIPAKIFSWTNFFRTIIVLALVWLVIDKFCLEPEDHSDKFRQEINKLQDEIKEQGKVIDSLDNSFTSMKLNLEKQYEKLDTLSVVGVDADVIDFRLRADHHPPRIR